MIPENPTLTLHNLIADIAEEVSLPKAKVAEIVRVLNDQVATALAEGLRVRLPLGTLAPKTLKARSGHIGGREYSSPAKTSVSFSPSKALKDALSAG